jgi:hypothetical protein
MRQKDFSVGKLASRHIKFGRLTSLALLRDLSLDVVSLLAERCASLRAMLDKVNRGSAQVARAELNLKIYNEMSALRDFRFSLREIAFLVPVFGYDVSRTWRNSYVCTPFEAVCIVIRRLSSPCRWADLEPLFGRHSPALSEIFRECIDSFFQNCSHHVVSFKSNLKQRRD